MKTLNEEEVQQIDRLFPIVKKFLEDYLTLRNIPFDIIWITKICAKDRVKYLHIEYMSHCVLSIDYEDTRSIDIPIKNGVLLNVLEYLKLNRTLEYETILKDKIAFLKEKVVDLSLSILESDPESEDTKQDNVVLLNLRLELNQLTKDLQDLQSK
jgi:hypothetical protein